MLIEREAKRSVSGREVRKFSVERGIDISRRPGAHIVAYVGVSGVFAAQSRKQQDRVSSARLQSSPEIDKHTPRQLVLVPRPRLLLRQSA